MHPVVALPQKGEHFLRVTSVVIADHARVVFMEPLGRDGQRGRALLSSRPVRLLPSKKNWLRANSRCRA